MSHEITQKFADHKRNDTWNGAIITITDNLGALVNLTGYKARMIFKLNANSDAVFGFTTEDSTMIIPAGASGTIQILKKLMNVPANEYYSDLQLTNPIGDVVSSEKRFSWLITPDFS